MTAIVPADVTVLAARMPRLASSGRASIEQVPELEAGAGRDATSPGRSRSSSHFVGLFGSAIAPPLGDLARHLVAHHPVAGCLPRPEGPRLPSEQPIG